MAADLTVDNLCGALRHFLLNAAENEMLWARQDLKNGRELLVYGTPADDTMKALMELFSGEFRIIVRELPEGMDLLEPPGSAPVFGNIIWHPEKKG